MTYIMQHHAFQLNTCYHCCLSRLDPKYAVVPSCLFLSLIRVCDDNLQPLSDVIVHSVSCTCR